MRRARSPASRARARIPVQRGGGRPGALRLEAAGLPEEQHDRERNADQEDRPGRRAGPDGRQRRRARQHRRRATRGGEGQGPPRGAGRRRELLPPLHRRVQEGVDRDRCPQAEENPGRHRDRLAREAAGEIVGGEPGHRQGRSRHLVGERGQEREGERPEQELRRRVRDGWPPALLERGLDLAGRGRELAAGEIVGDGERHRVDPVPGRGDTARQCRDLLPRGAERSRGRLESTGPDSRVASPGGGGSRALGSPGRRSPGSRSRPAHRAGPGGSRRTEQPGHAGNRRWQRRTARPASRTARTLSRCGGA